MQSESTKKQIKAIWAVLAMLTLWITIHTVKLNVIVPDFDSINKTLNVLIEKVNAIEDIDTIEDFYEGIYEEQLQYEKQLYKEQLEKDQRKVNRNSFEAIFNQMRETYGPGALFVWNGKEYTTFYREELTINQ